jgi:BA14K-like protein
VPIFPSHQGCGQHGCGDQPSRQNFESGHFSFSIGYRSQDILASALEMSGAIAVLHEMFVHSRSPLREVGASWIICPTRSPPGELSFVKPNLMARDRCRLTSSSMHLSMTAVTSASAQLPAWANSNPDDFQAQYPDRDVLNGGALTPAGKMGLELPGGAAPVFGANNAYAATGGATASPCDRLYHSYDPASGTFLGYDGRRHACE